MFLHMVVGVFLQLLVRSRRGLGDDDDDDDDDDETCLGCRSSCWMWGLLSRRGCNPKLRVMC